MPLTNQQIGLMVIWLSLFIIQIIGAGIFGAFSSKQNRFRNWFILVFLLVFILLAVMLFLYDSGVIPSLVSQIFKVSS